MSEVSPLRGPVEYPWLPRTDWPALAPYWSALRDGELRFPRSPCGRFQWYPQPICPSCHSSVFEWVAVEPAGVVFSHTTLRRAFIPAFAPLLPVRVAVVDVDAAHGVRLVSCVDPRVADTGDLHVGDVVRLHVTPVGDGISLPFIVPPTHHEG